MTHDELEQLLRNADADDAAPALDAGLADRVRVRANRRQRRVRTIWGAAATVACVIAAALWATRPDARSPARMIAKETTKPTESTAANIRAELAALSAEADRRAAVAEAMWSAQRRASRRPSLRLTTDAAEQVERAAFTMVYQAARMPADRGAASPAAGVYRRVCQTFPHTRWGEVARQRLSELEHRKDG